MNKKNLIILGSAFALLLIAIIWLLTIILAPAYTLAEAEPDLQNDPLQSAQPHYDDISFTLAGIDYTLFPQADYSVSALLISKRRYVHGFMHRLSPWDYGLAWGEMPQYLPNIKFKQMVRFLLFRYKAGVYIDENYVNRHVANTHLIPATPNIRRALARAKLKDKVKLEGYLVNVKAQKKGQGVGSWQSSLSREDTGNGACEVLYVKSLQIGKRRYE